MFLIDSNYSHCYFPVPSCLFRSVTFLFCLILTLVTLTFPMQLGNVINTLTNTNANTVTTSTQHSQNTSTTATFAELTAQQTEPQNGAINILTFIIPFTRDTISDPLTREAAYKTCVLSLLERLPRNSVSMTTISRIFVTIKNKQLHALRIISPADCAQAFRAMRVNGVVLLDRNVFPFGARRSALQDDGFPRIANVKFINLPVLCEDAIAIHALDLPEVVKPRTKLNRITEQSDLGTFFTGVAYLEVVLNNEQDFEVAQKWSLHKKLNPSAWNSVDILAHIPSIHTCCHCRDNMLSYIGHDDSWCRHAIFAKQRAELNARVIEQEAQPAVSVESLETQEESSNVSNSTPSIILTTTSVILSGVAAEDNVSSPATP